MPRNGNNGMPHDAARDYLSDRIEERQPAPAAMRWGFILTWFMRVLAIIWIMKGLSSWAVILGIWTPIGQFEARSTGYQATIIYFALIDLIAAVGLWMASTWGGIMWLLAVMSHLILAAFFPGIVSSGILTIVFFLTLIAVYIAVSWLAAQEE
ncbi:DUF6163 family protein [Microvirga guangxiensis]|uniref:DoxX-like family protein n=1 Tax=Microvirga guangxiensis TaxID=549386 RepID=A0A1G5J9I0_9HYPH|nr:DUF6163 family protein [Microvirga guangxiensis]SCY84581.1 hypothetical protein SAMN02927923_02570 [Microvirga guangxiensis]